MSVIIYIMKEIKCQHTNHKHRCYGENIYSKVGNEKRLALLDMVKLQGKSLKEAANHLNINYSTAKTILRVYRIENRILKKTPYQKKSKKNIFTSVNVERREETSSNNSVSSSEEENSPCSSNLDSEKNKKCFSPPPNFKLNEEKATSKETEKEKITNDFLMEQLRSVVNKLNFCISEVVVNEMTIRTILSFFEENQKAKINNDYFL